MATIIVDTSKFKRATGRVPPKKGNYEYVFSFNGETRGYTGTTFAAAINSCKADARKAGVNTITLENVYG